VCAAAAVAPGGLGGNVSGFKFMYFHPPESSLTPCIPTCSDANELPLSPRARHGLTCSCNCFPARIHAWCECMQLKPTWMPLPADPSKPPATWQRYPSTNDVYALNFSLPPAKVRNAHALTQCGTTLRATPPKRQPPARPPSLVDHHHCPPPPPLLLCIITTNHHHANSSNPFPCRSFCVEAHRS
jgi:hypothetical protein